MRVSARSRHFRVPLTYLWRHFEIAETSQDQQKRHVRRSRLIANRAATSRK
jgi:hypothetical protein